MDWIRLRRLLTDFRVAVAPDVAPFAAAMGKEESTVYRVENVKKYPDHKPGLPTIIAWLEQTNRMSLTDFFALVETTSLLPSLHSGETIDAPPAVITQSGASHVAGPFSSADAAAIIRLQSLLFDFAQAVAAAAAALGENLDPHPKEHRPVSDPESDSADSRAISSESY